MINTRTVVTAAGAAVAVYALTRGRRNGDVAAKRAHAARSVTIRGDAAAIYARCRDPQQLPAFFQGLQAVEFRGPGEERWTFRSGGRSRQVDVAIVVDDPGERFEWRTKRRGPFQGGGAFTLTAAPEGRGTQVRLALHRDGPGARAASTVDRIFGMSLEQIAMESLRRLKALVEAGEIPQAVRS